MRKKGEKEKRRSSMASPLTLKPPLCFLFSRLLKTLKTRTGGFAETERRRVTFPEIPAPVLEHVCQYFYYKLQYSNA